MSPLKNQFNIEEELFEEKQLKPEKPLENLDLEKETEIINKIPIRDISPDTELLDRKREKGSNINTSIFQERFTAEASRLTTVKTMVDLADDAEIVIKTGTTGWGFVMAGDNQEYGQFAWTSAGVVTLINNSANTVNTDTDAKLCIYDAGSGIAIKNRLGSTLKIRYELNYR